MLELDEIESSISVAMLADRHRLRRALRDIRTLARQGKPFDRKLTQAQELFQRSSETYQQRVQQRPAVTYPADLPVVEHREKIAEAIRNHPVVIVCGETGSGKSTQLPKICLDLGRGLGGMIGHTQPRRIAARTIAARLGDELKTAGGKGVGYKIRFTDRTDRGTYVKLMTDGILLMETQHDRFLEQYDTIIVDEAHERSLNIDFLLGYLQRLLRQRDDLRVVITSATIDAQRFSEHFGDGQTPAPVIEVSGRSYPVDVHYRPLEADEDDEVPDMNRAVADACEEAARLDRGDMLVFLPTERDIREVAKILRGRRFAGDNGHKTEILPLYSRLSVEQQNRVFQPKSQRRIVLATNVAESSLTVPRIKFVIDSGTARISRYAPRSKVQRLPIEAVARANADQRKGRCGRTAPGICFRLYSEDDYLGRDAFTTPEIRRTNLASVILQTLALKLGPIEEFPFLDPPRADRIREGYKTLFELSAIDSQNNLTEIGRQLSRLPVDPRIGRIILAAHDENCLHEVLIIAAALEVQEPRDRPVEKQQAADEQHAQFAHEQSDFLSYLKLWDFYHHLREKLSHSQLRKACKQNFINYLRMREWLDVQRQLRQAVESFGMKVQRRRDDEDAIHRALLAGLLSNIAQLTDRHEYTGAGGTKFNLWPGSAQFKKSPKWLVAGELVETSRRYLRTVGLIQPKWVEPLAEHLVKRTHSNPHWSRKRGAAMVDERVTLFGLTINPRRPVALAPINPEAARELLIRDGLVAGEIRTNARFFQQNQKMLEEISSQVDKTRDNRWLVDDSTLFRFYDARLPDSVVNLNTLMQWTKDQANRHKLVMTMADLLDAASQEQYRPEDFPDEVTVGAMALPVQYRYSPGDDSDGLTLEIPKEGLGRVSSRQLGWLVPGLLEEKVLSLIRSLPKSLRRNFVPAPDVARQVLQKLTFGQGDVREELALHLSQHAGETIRPGDFQLDRLPNHLRFHVRVLDAEGQPLASGRDVDELREQVGVEQAEVTAPPTDNRQWERAGIRAWDFGELPIEIKLKVAGVDVPFFPTVKDDGNSVSLCLLDNASRSDMHTRQGLRRLFSIKENRDLKSQVSWLPGIDETLVFAASLGSSKDIRDQLKDLIADRAFFATKDVPRDEDAFADKCRLARKEIGVATQQVLKVITPLFKAYHQAKLALESADNPRWDYASEDVANQLTDLTRDRFLVDTPWEWLGHLPRFFKAIVARFDKLKSSGHARDGKLHDELQPHVERWREIQDLSDRHTAEHITYRWMLEEFRVSLFAQELGTSQSVSSKRLDKQWAKLT